MSSLVLDFQEMDQMQLLLVGGKGLNRRMKTIGVEDIISLGLVLSDTSKDRKGNASL
ncbi:hypothetical protein [Brevibacillus parabrevis]|uniref:hypothetical protein n=1 Tax=Brevibacillus parabrevis TaxID=54914 RepID=UPI000A592705|nr:hypothetical protein [Brevibacillus parabrevis]